MDIVYTSDQMPGYRRLRKGRGFSYVGPDGITLTDKIERARIASLAVPPAYTNVWVCMLPHGHLQATGFDAKSRKQYRYHVSWHEGAADRKFRKLPDFVAKLPAIRAALLRELAGEDANRTRVIAGVVALLDETGYRIGNARYEKDNKTYGLSNLLMRHLKEESGQLSLQFRGKAGQAHAAEIENAHLVRLIRDLQELPGQHLFRYQDGEGEYHDIDTGDINSWLKETGEGDYTAKQFRTWKATLLCARFLAAAPPSTQVTEQKRTIRSAIESTAVLLNHTATVCRKYYIHPAIIASFHDGKLYDIMKSPAPALRKLDGTARLRADERRVFKLIRDHTAAGSRERRFSIRM